MKFFNDPPDPAERRKEVIDISYMTHDCFHFSQKGHALGINAEKCVSDSLLVPIRNRKVDCTVGLIRLKFTQNCFPTEPLSSRAAMINIWNHGWALWTASKVGPHEKWNEVNFQAANRNIRAHNLATEQDSSLDDQNTHIWSITQTCYPRFFPCMKQKTSLCIFEYSGWLSGKFGQFWKHASGPNTTLYMTVISVVALVTS